MLLPRHHRRLHRIKKRMLTPNLKVRFARSWFHKNYGFVFDESFQLDPLNRVKVEMEMERKLAERFPGLPLGNSDPQPSPGIFFQPLDIICSMFGSRWEFFKDKEVWSVDTPWKEIDSVEEIKNMRIPDLEKTWVIKEMLRQLRILKKNYKNGVSFYGGKEWGENLGIVHTPLTTAYKLVGERFFEELYESPAMAHAILNKVTEINFKMVDFFSRIQGKNVERIHLGDCAATMLSPQLYEEYGLKYNVIHSQRFGTCQIHSCGPSTHLLEVFAKTPHVKMVELGWYTDMRRSGEVFPKTHITASLDPVSFLMDDPNTVKRKIKDYISGARMKELTLVVEIEYGVPDRNIYAVYELMNEFE